MSLSDLASLGSFASGIAVVISLVTLTIQIRQNTRVMMRAEANAAQEQMSNWRLAIANSAELTNIWNRGLRDESLNEIEEARYSLLLNDVSFAFFQIWDRKNAGMSTVDDWKYISPRFAVILTTRRGAEWWERNKGLFRPSYIAEMDAAIRNLPEIASTRNAEKRSLEYAAPNPPAKIPPA